MEIDSMTFLCISTELFNATEKGDLEKVLALIEEAGDKASDLACSSIHSGWTSLMYAAIYKHEAIASVLINTAADRASELVCTSNYYGATALFFAANSGSSSIVRALIKVAGKKASELVCASDKSSTTALIFAANKGHKDIVAILIDAAGDKISEHIKVTDRNESSALAYACSNNHTDTAFLLMDAMRSEEAVCALKRHRTIGPFANKYIDTKLKMASVALYEMPSLGNMQGPLGIVASYLLGDEEANRRAFTPSFIQTAVVSQSTKKTEMELSETLRISLHI